MFDYHILHTLPPYFCKPRRYNEAAGLFYCNATRRSIPYLFR